MNFEVEHKYHVDDLAALEKRLASLDARILDEVEQITQVDPSIGVHLGPPCVVRERAKSSPYCPEGDRYCGVPVWRDWAPERGKYTRTI